MFTNPIWLIKLRLQLQMKKASENLATKKVLLYDGFMDAFQKITKKEGVMGLYKGTGPALLLTTHGGEICPYSVKYFYFFISLSEA